jgi:hypothetical protein
MAEKETTKKPSVSDQVEYNLKQQAGLPPDRTINVEKEKRINDWIKANPEDWKEILSEGLELNARREVLRRTYRDETAEREADRITEILKNDPILKARVEDRIRNVPLERQDQAKISVTKKILADDVLRQGQGIKA